MVNALARFKRAFFCFRQLPTQHSYQLFCSVFHDEFIKMLPAGCQYATTELEHPLSPKMSF